MYLCEETTEWATHGTTWLSPPHGAASCRQFARLPFVKNKILPMQHESLGRPSTSHRNQGCKRLTCSFKICSGSRSAGSFRVSRSLQVLVGIMPSIPDAHDTVTDQASKIGPMDVYMSRERHDRQGDHISYHTLVRTFRHILHCLPDEQPHQLALEDSRIDRPSTVKLRKCGDCSIMTT